MDLAGEPFSSACLVVDSSIKDKATGENVAVVLYSSGGNIVILFKEDCDVVEVMAAGEKYVGETLRTNRFKVFKAEVFK